MPVFFGSYKFVVMNWIFEEQTFDLYYHGNTYRAYVHMT